jgi:hypothetical protein
MPHKRADAGLFQKCLSSAYVSIQAGRRQHLPEAPVVLPRNRFTGFTSTKAQKKTDAEEVPAF